jgi:hypothetical protein
MAGLFLRTIHVLSLQTLRSAFYLELNLRTLFESPIPIHLDGRKMDEHIITVRALDKAIALSGVKPFHNTFFSHY